MRQLVLASGCIKMCHREQGGRGIKTQGFFFWQSFFAFCSLTKRYMDSVPLYTCQVQKTNEVCVGLHSLA